MPKHLLVFTYLLLHATVCVNAQSPAQALSASQLTFRAFPEADSVRQIERDVDRAARRKIERQLPFRVYFEELGTHTLHVAFRGSVPVGMLYTRPEETAWGITEIGWAHSLDGRVLGFEFSSSRSKTTDDLATSPFAKTLIGCDFDRLVTLLEAKLAQRSGSGKGPDDLACVVLRSALKASVVTRVVWQEEIRKLADLAMLHEEFPGAANSNRHIIQVAKPANEQTSQHLHALRVMEALGLGDYALGSVAHTRVDWGAKTIGLRWVFDIHGTIIRVRPTESWPSDRLRRCCNAMRGHRLDDPDLPDSPLLAAARQLGAELARMRGSKGGQ